MRALWDAGFPVPQVRRCCCCCTAPLCPVRKRVPQQRAATRKPAWAAWLRQRLLLPLAPVQRGVLQGAATRSGLVHV